MTPWGERGRASRKGRRPGTRGRGQRREGEDPAGEAEPKTMRYRVLHVAAVLAHRGRDLIVRSRRDLALGQRTGHVRRIAPDLDSVDTGQAQRSSRERPGRRRSYSPSAVARVGRVADLKGARDLIAHGARSTPGPFRTGPLEPETGTLAPPSNRSKPGLGRQRSCRWSRGLEPTASRAANGPGFR